MTDFPELIFAAQPWSLSAQRILLDRCEADNKWILCNCYSVIYAFSAESEQSVTDGNVRKRGFEQLAATHLHISLSLSLSPSHIHMHAHTRTHTHTCTHTVCSPVSRKSWNCLLLAHEISWSHTVPPCALILGFSGQNFILWPGFSRLNFTGVFFPKLTFTSIFWKQKSNSCWHLLPNYCLNHKSGGINFWLLIWRGAAAETSMCSFSFMPTNMHMSPQLTGRC